jgi:hypothetical protein
LSSNNWINIIHLTSDDIPTIFQSGTRYNLSDYCISDTWDIFFSEAFYDIHGTVVQGVPYIRESIYPNSGAIAEDFIFFELNGDGIPEIIVKFVERGVRNFDDHGWGYSINQYVLYSYFDDTYNEVGLLPNNFRGSSHPGDLSIISINTNGDIIIYADDGHMELRAYNFTTSAKSTDLVPIDFNCHDMREQWNANRPFFSNFQPLDDLQIKMISMLFEK